MTAPIQEPNLYRAHAGQVWSTNQLFRRPMPTGNFVPTVIRGRQITGGTQTIGTNTEELLEFNAWENCDEEVFEITTSVSSGFLDGVILLQEGIYSIGFELSIQDLTAGTQIVMLMNDGYDQASQVVYEAETASAGGYYTYPSIVRTFPIFAPNDNPPGVAEITFEIAISNAASRDTQTGTKFEIIYHGPYACVPMS